MTINLDLCLIGFALGLIIGAAVALLNNIIFGFFRMMKG